MWLLAKCHFFYGSNVNSSRYHLIFGALTFPPVALAAPANMFRPSWGSLTVSYVALLW